MPAYEPLELQVLSLLASARREVVLVAPFIKEAVVRRLLARIGPDVVLRIVTRWRVDEVVAGVSDPSVWPLVRDWGGNMYLLGNLHAKVFIVDDAALVGSANLTGAALAGAERGNLEVLVEVARAHPAVVAVEQFVDARACAVTDEIHAAVVEAAAAAAAPLGQEEAALWVPRFRHPRDLTKCAIRLPDPSDKQARLARQELAALGLPTTAAGASHSAVAAALRQQLVVQALAAFVDVPDGRRFGEVRQWLSQLVGAAEVDTQALIRWVVEFLPDVFRYSRPKYSEVLHRAP